MMIEIVAHLHMFHSHVASSLHAQMIRKLKRHLKRVTLKLKNTILSSFDL